MLVGKRGMRGVAKIIENLTRRHSNVIFDVESGMKADLASTKYGIHRTMVIKWVKEKAACIHFSVSEHKNFINIRPAEKYKEVYRVLLEKFKTARRKGFRRVDFKSPTRFDEGATRFACEPVKDPKPYAKKTSEKT